MPDDAPTPAQPHSAPASSPRSTPQHEADTARLQQRYATRAPRSVSHRSLMWTLAVAVLVAGVFVTWIVISGSNRPATKDVGFELISSSRITADFEVSKDPDDVVRCGVEALNENYAVVGYTETTIAEVDPERVVGRTSAHRVEIRTTNQANSAQVTQCWLVD